MDYNKIFDNDADDSEDESEDESEDDSGSFATGKSDIKCIGNKNHEGRKEDKISDFYMENQVFYKDITELKGELSSENSIFDTSLDIEKESYNNNKVKNNENENEELDQFIEGNKNNKQMGEKRCISGIKNFFCWALKIRYSSFLSCFKS